MPEGNILEEMSKAPVETFLDKYVGDGKKYANEEELAKAYAHAEEHINTMKGDNSHLREEFDAFRELMTEQLTKREPVQALSNPNPNPDDKSQKQEPASSAPLKAVAEDDLDARIAKLLEESDEKKRLQSNADLAQEVMIKHFGSKEDAIAAVQKRAEELQVAPEWLADSAFRSPKAFFASMGIDPGSTPRSTSTPASRSDVSVERLKEVNPNVQPGTYEHYQEIRRKDPGKFYSADIQTRMLSDAIEKGPDFYKR